MSIFNQSMEHPLEEARKKYIEIINESFQKYRRPFVSPSEMEGYLAGEISYSMDYFYARGVQYHRIHVYSNKFNIHSPWRGIKKRFNVIVKVKISDCEPLYRLVDINI